MAGSDESQALPMVRKIGMTDLKDALAKGVEDFWAIPTHVIFLSIIYPVIALVLAELTLNNLVQLFFPLAAGFALIGPVAALGLCELSRRRELGLDLSWTHAFGVRHSASIGRILALAVLLAVIFLLWVAVSEAIYIANFGYAPAATIPNFFRQVFTTPEGWTLIVVGNGVGFLFAVVVFIISVVSFPLLLDRDVGAGVAKARAGLVDERKREAGILAALQAERASVAAKGRQMETESAPIRYVAELLGVDTDSERAIRWLIALIVLCCDPLAIALTAAASARR
jgi:uncharacterized membrane protein